MRFLHALSGFVLFIELPIPIFWLIIHPFSAFWRKRVRTAFWFAGLTAWTCGGVALWLLRHRLLSRSPHSWIAIASGLTLIAAEAYILVRVERELGSCRLVGHAELTGTGEIFSGGLYAYVRHPRYAAMFAAVLGAALIAGSALLLKMLPIWFVFALSVIRLEERELASRFGRSYEEYRRRVPAFVPMCLGSRENARH
jgi:protein-S-isoprenylcysteine O-methyltransferase Ste14